MHKFYPVLAAVLCLGLSVSAQVDLQITEMWPGNEPGKNLTSDWFEVVNNGSTAWVSQTSPAIYYDDDSQDPNKAKIVQGVSDILPGESVIVIIGKDTDVTEFYDIWSKSYALDEIEIGYTDGSGLGGGGDGVTLFLGNPTPNNIVDYESYPNAKNNGGQSYDVALAAFSVVGNANMAAETTTVNDAYQAAIASPGNQGPLKADPNAPKIKVDIDKLTPYLELSEEGPSAVSGVIDDLSDPATTIGIPFSVSDDNTLVSLTTNSNNTTVLPNENVRLTPAFDSNISNYILTLHPTSVGKSTITLTLKDNDGKEDEYVIEYAVSASSLQTVSTYHTGASDGSTAIPVGTGYMWVGDDEDQTLRLYNKFQSGLPIKEINFNDVLGSTEEVDIEGSIRKNDVVYWIGSSDRSDRSVLFATTISGDDENSTLSYEGKYTGLRDDLLNAGFGLPTNFNIESLALAPDGDTVYLGFRFPDNNGKAIVIPVSNWDGLIGSAAGSAQFGTPINLDLYGRTIRSMECNEYGCIIIGGPNSHKNDFRLYTWSGDSVDAPKMHSIELGGNGAWEGIVTIPTIPFVGNAGYTAIVELISDLGSVDLYNDGKENKSQRKEWKKFRSNILPLGVVVPNTVKGPVINEFVANHTGTDSHAYIEILGDPNTDYSSFTLLEIEGDNGNDLGKIDAAKTIGNTNAGGYFVDAEDVENGSVTLLLVEEFTGNVGEDIDANDDGTIDVMPWTRIVDGVAVSDGNAADLVYAVELSPNFDFMNAPVGGASRIPNGTDTDKASDWVRNDYDGAGIPSLEPGTPIEGEAINTPGEDNKVVLPPMANLQITEIWPGSGNGSKLTEDWFEITNTGSVAWSPALGDLYFDDESKDPSKAVQINGIVEIKPGEVVIAVDDTSTDQFLAVWGSSYILKDIQIGTYSGAGLSKNGDAVALWVGNPTTNGVLSDYETFPSGAANGGQSYDVELAEFSVVGNANHAAATKVKNDAGEAAIGSPGNQGPNLNVTDFVNDEKVLQAYPVPFDNVLHIDLGTKKSAEYPVKMYNVLGEVVFAQNIKTDNGKVTLNNLANLPTGTYVLSLPTIGKSLKVFKR